MANDGQGEKWHNQDYDYKVINVFITVKHHDAPVF